MEINVIIKKFASGNRTYRRADNNALLGYIYRNTADYFVREVWNGNICRRASFKNIKVAEKSLRQMIENTIHAAGNKVVFENCSSQNID